MKKFLIFSVVGVVIIIALVAVVGYINEKKQKSFSPEDEITFNDGTLRIVVFYNRPYKKGRDIFGGLVPYGEVWRTGANEATTFQTNQDLKIKGKTLKAGKYTLWSIPKEDMWTVIFNSEYGQWGINSKGEANRDPSRDLLSVEVQSLTQEQVFEQFTIEFQKTGQEAEMVLIWDQTLVVVPFSY